MSFWRNTALLCLCLGQIAYSLARQHATCRLSLQGVGDSFIGRPTSLLPAALECLSTAPVAVAINSTLVHAENFSGVTVIDPVSACGSAVGLQGTSLSALLYFCGDYDLDLPQPVFRGLKFDSNSSAILAFGGNVSAVISEGVFDSNSGTVLLAMQQAVLQVKDSNATNNTAYAAAVAYATDNSSVTIISSTVTGSTALAPAPVDRSAAGWHCVGGAILAADKSTISVQGSVFDKNTAAFGGAIASIGNSSVNIWNSEFAYNVADIAGGVSCAQDNSSHSILKSTFSDNVGCSSTDPGAAGALFLRDGATASIAASTFGNNKASMWGGAIYAQNYTAAWITSTRFNNNSVAAWGGAINIYDAALVTLDNCTLTNNSALRGGGGGLLMGVNSTAVFTNCMFSNNSGKSGGSLYANGLTKVTVRQTQLLHSSAGTGAAMHCEGNTTVSFDGCSVINNTADAGGGGIYIIQAAMVAMSSCMLISNAATYGGGMMAAGNSSVTLSDVVFRNNSAGSSGGAVFTDNTAQVALNNGCRLTNNSAETGGGLFCVGNSSLAAYSSRVEHNMAVSFGGGADVGGYATVAFHNSTLSNNAAETGGALRCSSSSTTTLAACEVSSNSAKGVAGAMYATGQAQVHLNDSRMLSNVGPSGGAVFQDTSSTVRLSHSQVSNNRAAIAGGALYSRDDATVDVEFCTLSGNSANDSGGAYFGVYRSKGSFVSSSIENNTAANAGGAVYLRDSAMVNLGSSNCSGNFAPSGGCIDGAASSSLTLSGASVHSNSAYRGGGMYLDGFCRLNLVSNGSEITMNEAKTRSGMFAAGADFGGVGGGVYLISPNFIAADLTRVTQQNTAPFGSDVGVAVQRIAMDGNSSVRDFASRLGSDAGLLQLLVNVTGPQGLPCHGAQVQAVLDGNQFLGINRSDSSGNVYMTLKVQKPPGAYSIALSSPDAPWVPAVTMELHVRSCLPGEVTPSPDACLECPAGYYSLDPTAQVCDVCPPGADCSSNLVIPVVGMWSSAADSVQVHSCPNQAGCQGDRAAATACAADATCRTTSNFPNLQCSPQYHGHLCGKCVDGYALTAPFVCRKCLQPGALIALYVVAGCLMLLFIRLLCSWTRSANRTRCRAAITPAGSGPLQPADLAKPFVLFLQWQLIVATASGIDWKAPLSWVVAALGWIWSATSPQTLSLQCMLSNEHENEYETPAAFKAVLLYLFIPVAMLLVSLLMDACLAVVRRQRRSIASARVGIADSLMSNLVVAVIIFLPIVVRTLFSLFACVPIDEPVSPPAVAAAVGSFWASDPSLQCFHGIHKAWALSLGIPLVLLVCICLPAALIYKTVANRKQLDDLDFMHHWGSLYLYYKRQFCFFEGVIAVSTIVLVAISVFGLNLGQFYQLLVLNMALLVVFATFLGLRPYVQPAANTVAVQAIALLMLTCYAGMSLIPSSRAAHHHDEVLPGPEYTVAVSVVVMVLNVVFIGSVVWRLVRLVDWQNFGNRFQGCLSTASDKCGGVSCICIPGKQDVEQQFKPASVASAGSTAVGPGKGVVSGVPANQPQSPGSWKGSDRRFPHESIPTKNTEDSFDSSTVLDQKRQQPGHATSANLPPWYA